MRGPADSGRTPSTTRRRRTRQVRGQGRRRPRRPGLGRTVMAPTCPAGTSTTTTPQSAASFKFIVLPTPPSIYRRSPIVTGGHAPGTAQLAATASTRSTPDARSKPTSSPVPMSIAVMRISRSGQSWRRQPLGDHLPADRLGQGGGRACDRPDALQFLRRRGARNRERLQKQRGDVVDIDVRVDLLRMPGDLAVVQLVKPQPAAQLGGDRRTGRCAEQYVGIQQRARRFRRFVFDPAKNAGLPGDSRQPPARQHQCSLRCHRQSLPGWR